MEIPRPAHAALAGVLATAAGLAAGHLAAALVAPAASPVVAVWNRSVDLTPTPLKEWAVAVFGLADKAVLLVGIVVVTLGLGALVGLLARRSLAAALVAAGLLAFVALLAGSAVPGLGGLLPAPVAFGVGAVVLRRLSAAPAPVPAARSAPPAEGGRRRLLRQAGAVLGASAVTAGLGEWLIRSRVLGGGVRPAPTPPVPTGAATPLPAGLEATAPGVSPLFTPNSDFFRIDTALRIPQVDATNWSLAIDGMVDRPLTLTWAELVGLPALETDVTLACVSNDVGGDLIGNARWRGVATAALLARAGVQAGADQVLSRSVDGFTVSTPLAALTDDRGAMLAYSMNGAPLPAQHGFPVRLLTPGLYGFVGATKWIVSLTVTTYARDEAYWTTRGWAIDGPVRPNSTIETPRPGSVLGAGPVKVGGVAWAHGSGVGGVQVSVDDGPWQDAPLGPDAGVDSWRQWLWSWDATPGEHVLRCRVVDGAGRPQPEDRLPPFPSGSSGLHAIRVTVR